MGLTYARGLTLLLTASLLAISVANNYGFNESNWAYNGAPNCTDSPRKIIVGGSTGWQFGFDYNDWAMRNGPFYLNDTLVFKYDPPSDNNTRPHSVYLLPNWWSFARCNLRRAKMIANVSDGAGEGFEFVLNKWQPYYFACGASNGIHCNIGKMKFFVMPLLRCWGY